jgi:hypothetical protein
MLANGTLTVAIVTARRNDETTYKAWGELGRAIINGERKDPNVNGEWLALLSALRFFPPVAHHVIHQLRALALQTELPNEVLVIDRCFGDEPTFDDLADAIDAERFPFLVRWMQPKIGVAELQIDPGLGVYHSQLISPAPSLCGLPKRTRAVPYMNSDKNSALIHALHDNVLMLDDCCIPGIALINHAKAVCARNNILLIGHRALYLPNEHRDFVEIADSNWNNGTLRNVFGIWAAPVNHLLAINGCNEVLDGARGANDLELKYRMNMHLENVKAEYEIVQGARCYEIEHTYPWDAEGTKHPDNWKSLTDGSWKAPGPALRELRKTYKAGNAVTWTIIDGADQEETNDAEEDFEEGED